MLNSLVLSCSTTSSLRPKAENQYFPSNSRLPFHRIDGSMASRQISLPWKFRMGRWRLACMLGSIGQTSNRGHSILTKAWIDIHKLAATTANYPQHANGRALRRFLVSHDTKESTHDGSQFSFHFGGENRLEGLRWPRQYVM